MLFMFVLILVLFVVLKHIVSSLLLLTIFVTLFVVVGADGYALVTLQQCLDSLLQTTKTSASIDANSSSSRRGSSKDYELL